MPPLEQGAGTSPARTEYYGLDGPPCRERAGLDQGYDVRPPCQQMCRRCGRMTARRDADGGAWCGGELPEGVS